MQTTRAIAGRVLVAPSRGETGVPNIAGEETTDGCAYLRSTLGALALVQAARS